MVESKCRTREGGERICEETAGSELPKGVVSVRMQRAGVFVALGGFGREVGGYP